MSNTKLFSLKKNFGKFVKKPILSGNVPGLKDRGIFSRHLHSGLRKLSLAHFKVICGKLVNDEKILSSIFRYHNASFWISKLHTSRAWSRISPPRPTGAKGIWGGESLGAGQRGGVPGLSRGFNDKAAQLPDRIKKTHRKGPEREILEDGQHPSANPTGRDVHSEISEQKFYTRDVSLLKSGSSQRRKRKGAEPGSPRAGPELDTPPPSFRCRLSCPLPPQGFLPPEKLDFLSVSQSPSVRFAILQSEFLPQKKQLPSSEPLLPTPPPQRLPEKKPKDPPPSDDYADLRPFREKSVKYLKNYLNLRMTKSQMYTAQDADFAPKMRALVFEPTGLQLNYGKVYVPTKIYKDEVLVQVSYAGVSGHDLFIKEGKVFCGDDKIILGQEISGKVYATGSDVHHVAPGNKVAVDAYPGCCVCRYCCTGNTFGCLNGGLNNSIGVSKNGGWAEFVVVKKSQVHKIPDKLGLDQAVLVLPLSCILSAVSKLKLSYSQNILIQGLGLSGSLWASVLHSRGFRKVMVSEKSEKKKTQFESLGLDYAFVPLEDVRKHTADVVVDCTGSPASIEKAFNILNPNGQMCFFGKPNPVAEVRCLPYEIIQKEITIVGNAGNSLCFAEAIDVALGLGDRYLDLPRLGVQVFDLEDFSTAFFLKKSGEIGKIIFKIDS